MQGNPYLLRLLNLPVFSNSRELAEVMHIDYAQIKLFNRYSNAGHYYLEYKIPKPNGRSRIIRQPGARLKAIQAWILRNILDKLTPSPHATAFIKKRSLIDNVLPHCYNEYFLCLDLEDFFPSIPTWRVSFLFCLIGYNEEAASTLANLCTCKNGLPQGGVTSPAISNLIAGKLDRRLSGYTSRKNIIYTRYADDMTFSCNNPKSLCRSFPMLRKIIETSGFRINDSKTRRFGPRRSCRVTGLIKNHEESKFGVGRKKKRLMRAVMHNVIIKGGMDAKYQTESSLEGWLSYLSSVDSESFQQMSEYYASLKEKACSS